MTDVQSMAVLISYNLPCEVRQRQADEYKEIELTAPTLPVFPSRLFDGLPTEEPLNEIAG
ncbi:hypothetical protein PG993_009432 [Apiospora rasikravindrae]|uniref:Uncharacterized protein n=1 Tax=Apiospora rasikravindrae TaxID=990691 RepID=A0ABR1SJD9_9PEZI